MTGVSLYSANLLLPPKSFFLYTLLSVAHAEEWCIFSATKQFHNCVKKHVLSDTNVWTCNGRSILKLLSICSLTCWKAAAIASHSHFWREASLLTAALCLIVSVCFAKWWMNGVERIPNKDTHTKKSREMFTLPVIKETHIMCTIVCSN